MRFFNFNIFSRNELEVQMLDPFVLKGPRFSLVLLYILRPHDHDSLLGSVEGPSSVVGRRVLIPLRYVYFHILVYFVER